MSGLRRSLLALAVVAGVLPVLGGPASASPACFGRAATRVGSLGPDTIAGTPGRDVVAGRKGNDVLVGGDGDDRICGGPGKDRIRAYDGFVDRIDCGSSTRDRVLADPHDKVAANCEYVTVLNHAATDLSLSNDTVPAGSPLRTVVGTFSAVDVDPRDPSRFSFAKGPGSGDNPVFLLDGNVLRTYSVWPEPRTFSIRVRATDFAGKSVLRTFTIRVVPRT